MKKAFIITVFFMLLMLTSRDLPAEDRFMLDLGPEQFVQADAVDIKVPEYSVPSFVDWNSDGLNDLVIGEKTSITVGKVRIYLNQGTAETPEFSSYFYAQSSGVDLTCTASGCMGCYPRVVHWDHDGKKDLLVGLADGRIKIYMNINTDAEPKFDAGTFLTVENGLILDVGDRATPDFADWNYDGKIDIVSGGLDGKIHVYANCGCSDLTPEFNYMPVGGYIAQLDGSRGDLIVPSGRSSPVMVDLNNDGFVEEFLTGNTEGQLFYHEATGFFSDPEHPEIGAQTLYSNGVYVQSDGNDINIAGTPRSRLFVCDWKDDGYLDVLIGSADGKVRLYQSRGVIGDIDKDFDVDTLDFADLANAWKTAPADPKWNRRCDISDPNDNVIDVPDLEIMTQNWLKGL